MKKKKKRVISYVHVSSKSQLKDLETQYINARKKYGKEIEVFNDVASGINEKRQELMNDLNPNRRFGFKNVPKGFVITKICLKLEKIFNRPQDIEWCIYDNRLWILQSRSITGGMK
ncbi:MAG: PEP/pyruvate-binding domain-containing protein [Methanosarcinales archaeon]